MGATARMKKTGAAFICFLFIYTIPLLCPAGEASFIFSAPERVNTGFESLYPLNEEAVIFPSEEDRDYEETEIRRFEIVFFVSLPASILFSLAGIGMFRAGSGRTGNLITPEYGYLLLSSAGISFAIALHDNRAVFRKKGIR